MQKLISTILLVISSWGVIAQIPDITGSGRGPGQQNSTPQNPDYFAEDTSKIFYYYADRPAVEYLFSDSLIGKYAVQYDPIRERDWDYVHQGHLGSAHQPVVFDPIPRAGFDVGFHQYDLYIRPPEQLPFYNITRPFTNLEYAQVAEQSNGFVEAQFSRNFAQGINLSIDYHRINQIGTQTKFTNQDIQHTSLSFGLAIRGATDKYQGFLSVASNTMRQENNGGIKEEPSGVEGFNSPTSATVFLNSAETRYALRELSYTHYLNLRGGVDTVKNKLRRNYAIGHAIGLSANKYKMFADTTGISATVMENLLVDPRGIRHFIEYEKISNHFFIRSFKPEENNSQSSDRNRKGFFQLGLEHAIYFIDQEATDSTINTLFARGRLNVALRDRLFFRGEAALGLLDQVGDYRISGQLLIDLKGIGSLEVKAANQLATPNLVQSRLYINQQKFWDNDFNKTLSTTLEASYTQPKLGLKLTGRYHLVNNFIYFDTLGTARQTGVPLSVFQLILQEDLKVGVFSLDNVLILQSSSEDELRVPDFYTKHSLYYQDTWFKFLLIRIGADLRLQDTYRANYYNPLIGQYILQERQEVELYPALDVYATFRVTKFQAFFKWENMVQNFDQNSLFYLTALHPHPNASGFRVGFSWRFWD